MSLLAYNKLVWLKCALMLKRPFKTNTMFFLKKMGHSRPLFLYFRLFNTQLTVHKCSI